MGRSDGRTPPGKYPGCHPPRAPGPTIAGLGFASFAILCNRFASTHPSLVTHPFDTFAHYGDNLATVVQLLRREPDRFYPAPKQEGE